MANADSAQSGDGNVSRSGGLLQSASDAPLEPGTFPLAHGIPGRVGRLRGYGNAINPWVAAAFIRATEDAVSSADWREEAVS